MIDKIEETTRILVPPTFEECPYLRYEFESIERDKQLQQIYRRKHIDLIIYI